MRGAPATLDELAERLRVRRVLAGAPSYQRIAERVAAERTRRGVPAADRTPGKITVYDCFRDGRKRIDSMLIEDIVRTFGADDAELGQWRSWCAALTIGAPSAAVVAARIGLPDSDGTFVARDEERRTVRSHTRVVLSGMPGVGKTALALEAMRERLSAGAISDVLIVDVHGSRGPVHPGAILDAIERVTDGPVLERADLADRAAAVSAHLAAARVGLVLDDVGTFADVADLVRTARSPVIVAMRTVPDVAENTTVVQVRPWEHDATITLLATRVGQDRVDAEPEAAAEIAHLAGGLPLAAALTASRIADKPGWTLADHRDALRMRSDGLRLEDAVHEAVQLTVAALGEQEQRALRLLATQPCEHLSDRQFAALIGEADAAGAALAERLARANCVQRPAHGRVGLHALVRTFAIARSWEEDPQGVRDRAVDRLAEQVLDEAWAAADAAYPGAVERSRNPGRSVATWQAEVGLDWLRTEIASLAALTRAVAGRHPDYPPVVSEVTSRFLFEQGLLHLAIKLHGDNAIAADLTGDDSAVAVTRLPLGTAQVRAGDSVAGAANLRLAYSAAIRGGVPRIEVAALSNLAADAAGRGDLTAAASAFRSLRETCERHGFADLVPTTIDNLAIMLRRSGDLVGAVAHHREAYALSLETGNIVQAAGCLANVVDPLLELGRIDEAIEAAREARTLANGISDATYTLATSNLAGALRELGQLDEALQLQLEATARADASGNAFQRAALRLSLGEIHLARGADVDADRAWTEGLSIATDAGLEYERARLLFLLANLDLRRGDRASARVRVTSSIAAFGNVRGPEVEQAETLLAALS